MTDQGGVVAAVVAAIVVSGLVVGRAGALPPNFQSQLVLSGLDEPICVDFLPADGRMLVLQKNGAMLIADPVSGVPATSTPYMTITDIDAGGERGLIDIAFDPDFASNNWFYVYYHPASTVRFRISRFTHLGNTGDLGSEVVIWEDTDNGSSCCHYGGGLDFGPDECLYLTIGDHFVGSLAQDPTRSAGSIIRIFKDGSIPPDNPFNDGAGPNDDSIWAIGLRNPFRARWDLPTERLFIAEVGGNNQGISWEDIHLGAAGKNYGWPLCEGACDNADFPSCNCLTHDDPLFSYPHEGFGASVTGGFVYRGSQFPTEFVGSYFFGDYVRQFLAYLTFDGTGLVVTDALVFEVGVGEVVDLAEGPQGALYYANIGDGSIRRIVYDGGNQAPTVLSATADVTSGLAPLTVEFSALASDPEQDPIMYDWEFGDGNVGSGSPVTNTYMANGRYEAQVFASDPAHVAASDPIIIQVGELPVAKIQSPRNGATFRAGDDITLMASGSDPDGKLVDGDFVWTVSFIHNEHTHPGDTFVGPSAVFSIPTSGHDFSDDTGFRVTLTITDADDLSTVQSVEIEPEKVNLSFDTVPSGQQVYVDDLPRVTPFVLDTLIDFQHTIRVDDGFCDAGVEQSFDAWSDGGDAEHVITVPDMDAAFTASFVETGQCLVVLYRLNAGGPGLVAADGDWEADSGQYSNTGNAAVTGNSIDMTHPSVIPGTPMPIFQSERWDPEGDPDMSFDFPVPTGTDVEVRLHFSEIAHGGSNMRIFDTQVEGQLVLDDLDVAAEVGSNRALTYRLQLRSDGNVDVDFFRVLANPMVMGIEILQLATDTIVCDGTEDDCNANGVSDPCETAPIDGAMRFDGIDDWVSIPSVSMAGDFTIEAWVRLQGAITDADGIMGQEALGQDINFSAERVRLDAPGDVIIATTPTVPDVWTHYAITRSGSSLTLYIDGVQDATGKWSGVFAPDAIGRANAGFTRGDIDEVRIWSVARAQPELQATMFRTVPSNEPGLTASWSFDEFPASQDVLDRAGNASGTRGAGSDLALDDPFRVVSDAPVTSLIDQNGNGVPDECDCLADFSGGGEVAFEDMVTLLVAWGPCPVGPFCPDLDGDGSVGLTDLSLLLTAWGDCP